MKIIKKLDAFNSVLIVHVCLLISMYALEGYKYILVRDFPLEGSLTKDTKPIWDKVMAINNFKYTMASILGIIALACLLLFVYNMGKSAYGRTRKYIIIIITYMVIVTIMGYILSSISIIPKGNYFELFLRSTGYFMLIILIGFGSKIIRRNNSINCDE